MKYTKKINKKILTGDEKLFSEKDWLPYTKLWGEKQVLTSPLFERAFNLILEKHKVKRKTMFISQCTSTRPYYLSPKWAKFKEDFGNLTDLVVLSNAGVIPESFWCSYPFLNYNSGRNRRTTNDKDIKRLYIQLDTKLYNKKTYEKVKKFLKKHSYSYVVANFSFKSVNYLPINKALFELKKEDFIKDYVVIPDKKTYLEAKATNWQGLDMGYFYRSIYPDLSYVINQKLTKFVNLWGNNNES